MPRNSGHNLPMPMWDPAVSPPSPGSLTHTLEDLALSEHSGKALDRNVFLS